MAYRLIIFDCDGTLVDSEALTNGLISVMINERGIQITQEECLAKFAGKTLVDITDYIKSNGVEIDDSLFEKEYRKRCFEVFNKDLKPIPGVRQLLDALKIPFCVASNGPHEKMAVTLPAAGLDNYFDKTNTFSAYDVQKWKPDAALFLYAADKMGVEPKECLVIEDTWSGAMGGVNAGMDVYVYNPHDDQRVFIDGVANFNSVEAIERELMPYL